MQQVALIGGDASTHEDWDAAVQHVAQTCRVDRAELFFRSAKRGLLIFEGWSHGPQQPLGCVLTPAEYQAAKSSGDLEDPAQRPPHVALAGPLLFARTQSSTLSWLTNDPSAPTMSKIHSHPTKKTADEPTSFIVVADGHLIWQAKAYRQHDIIRTAPRNKKEEDRRALHLKKGWIRAATAEEAAAAANLAPGSNIVKLDAAAFAGAADHAPTATADGIFVLLDPRTIAPSPVNPRRHFDEAAMEELTANVREKGVRVAIHVRPTPPGAWEVRHNDATKRSYYLHDTRRGITVFPPEIMQIDFPRKEEAVAALPKWEIIAGERRWRASRRAGSATIRAIVEHLDDEAAAELQVIENDQREDLTPLEAAASYKYLLSLPGYSMERLVSRIGRKKNTIWGKLKMLDAPEPAQKALENGKLSPSVVEEIGRQDEAIREEAAKRILGMRKDAWSPEERAKPVTYKEAERVIDDLKEERRKDQLRQQAADEARSKGWKVLTGEEAAGVFQHGSEVSSNCGYVDAGDKCPRDPNGRRWQQVFKDQEGVTPYAVIHWVHSLKSFRTTPLYKREDANAVLKRLGLWNAEGSRKTKELEAQREKKAKHGRDIERAQEHLDALSDQAARSSAPEVLRVALFALIHVNSEACYHAAKRRLLIPAEDMNWTNRGKAQRCLRGLVQAATLKVLSELAADLSAISLASDNVYFRDGIKSVAALLGMEEPPSGEAGGKGSADICTDYDPSLEPEEQAA